MYGQVLFWMAFAAPNIDDIVVNPDDLESDLLPELEEAAAEIAAVLRRRGWKPSDWKFGYYDDRPPADLMRLEPPVAEESKEPQP